MINHLLLMYSSIQWCKWKKSWLRSSWKTPLGTSSTLHSPLLPSLISFTFSDEPTFLVFHRIKIWLIWYLGTTDCKYFHTYTIFELSLHLLKFQVHVGRRGGWLQEDIHPCTNWLWHVLRFQSTHNPQVEGTKMEKMNCCHSQDGRLWRSWWGEHVLLPGEEVADRREPGREKRIVESNYWDQARPSSHPGPKFELG